MGTRSSPVAFHRWTRERCCRLAGFAARDGFAQVAPDRAEWVLSFKAKLGVCRVFMHGCWPLDGDCCRCRLAPSGPVSAYLPGTGGTLITKDVLPGRGLSIALRFGWPLRSPQMRVTRVRNFFVGGTAFALSPVLKQISKCSEGVACGPFKLGFCTVQIKHRTNVKSLTR